MLPAARRITYFGMTQRSTTVRTLNSTHALAHGPWVARLTQTHARLGPLRPALDTLLLFRVGEIYSTRPELAKRLYRGLWWLVRTSTARRWTGYVVGVESMCVAVARRGVPAASGRQRSGEHGHARVAPRRGRGVMRHAERRCAARARDARARARTAAVTACAPAGA